MAIPEALSRLLKSKKLSVTKQRIAILEILSGDHVCLGVNDLLSHAKKKKKNLGDWSTVFRTVKAFEELGIVKAYSFKDGITRYELNEEEHVHHHHHFVCTQCGTIFPIDNCPMHIYEKEAKKVGFTIQDHVIEVQGQCKDCQSNL